MTTTQLHNEDNNISNESTTRARRRIGITASIAAATAAATVATALSLGAFVTPASASSSPTPAHVTKVTPARSAAVAKLQRELAQLNYYIGPLDGIMGPRDDRGHHLPATGRRAGVHWPYEPANRGRTGLLPGPRQQSHGWLTGTWVASRHMGGQQAHGWPAGTGWPAGPYPQPSPEAGGSTRRVLPPRVFTYASSVGEL